MPTVRQAIESICWSRWPDLPDMVFAANGAIVVDGQHAAGQIRQPERAAEAALHAAWHRRNGILYGGGDVQPAIAVNEAEGDFAVLSEQDPCRLRLPDNPGGSSRACHADWSRGDQPRADRSRGCSTSILLWLSSTTSMITSPTTRMPSVSRAAGCSLSCSLMRSSRTSMTRTPSDSTWSATGCMSSSPREPVSCAKSLPAAGYWPISVDLSELLKGGGSVKCCTQEIRPSRVPARRAAPLSVEVSSLVPNTASQHAPSQRSAGQHRDHHGPHPYPGQPAAADRG